MSATGTPTPNLGLRIPLGTDPASVDDINYNSNALDTIIGDIGETSVAGQLGAANNRISAVQAGLAIVCNCNTHAAIESGQFAYVKNHGTLAEGLYRNNTGSTIAANATLSSSNLTADSSGGLNTVYESLNSNIFKIVSNGNITQDHAYLLFMQETTISNAYFSVLYDPAENNGMQSFGVILDNGTNLFLCAGKLTFSNGTLSLSDTYRCASNGNSRDAWNVSIRYIRMIA